MKREKGLNSEEDLNKQSAAVQMSHEERNKELKKLIEQQKELGKEIQKHYSKCALLKAEGTLYYKSPEEKGSSLTKREKMLSNLVALIIELQETLSSGIKRLVLLS